MRLFNWDLFKNCNFRAQIKLCAKFVPFLMKNNIMFNFSFARTVENPPTPFLSSFAWKILPSSGKTRLTGNSLFWGTLLFPPSLFPLFTKPFYSQAFANWENLVGSLQLSLKHRTFREFSQKLPFDFIF